MRADPSDNVSRIASDRGLVSINMGVPRLHLKQGSYQHLKTIWISYAASSVLAKARSLLSNPWLVAGLCIYAVEVFVWLKILSVAPLSIAFPIASLNFLGVMLASATILREKVGRPQWVGAWLVTIGVAIVAGTA